MPEPITIKERIERRLLEIVAVIDGVSAAERWDARGNTKRNRSVVLVPGDEQAEEGGSANSGTTEKKLTLEFHTLVAQGADDSEVTASALNRWLGRIALAVLADPLLTDPDTGERLAIDVREVASLPAPVDSEQPEAYSILVIEVLYAHHRDNPYTAPWIAQKEV